MPKYAETPDRPRASKVSGFWLREVVLATSFLSLALLYLGTHIVPVFLGFWLYYFGYIRTALGDEMESACFRILRKEEKYPLGTLSWADWCWFKRCQGNRDGFEMQGEIWSTFAGWVYDLTAPVVLLDPWPVGLYHVLAKETLIGLCRRFLLLFCYYVLSVVTAVQLCLRLRLSHSFCYRF